MRKTCAGPWALPMHVLRALRQYLHRDLEIAYSQLTLTGETLPIDRCTDDHNVVHNRETAFASCPISLLVPDLAVGEHGRLVHRHSLLVKLLRIG